MNTDRDLQKAVIDELEWQPSVNAANIGVSVKNGIVTLTGHVDSYAAKCGAELAASRVKGVKGVAQELEVRLPTDKKFSDDQIAERVVNIMAWDDRIPADRVKVKVEHGVVTLYGSLDWYYQKAAAEHDVRQLSGVVAVNNHIELKPAVAPTYVRNKIEESLNRMARLDAKAIKVEVEGHRVTLTGNVHGFYERKLAEEAAWAAPGVSEVKDFIQVS